MAIACDRVRDLASGFVLGALDPAEMAAVHQHVETCRKPHPELREMGGVVPYLGAALEPVEPPARLRAAVLAAAMADLQTRRAAEPTIVPATRTAAVSIVSLQAVRRSRLRRAAVWTSRAAAALVLVGALGFALGIPARLGIGTPRPEPTFNFGMLEPGSRSFLLTPADDSGASGGIVIRPNGHLRVIAQGLTPTKNDEVYVVWLTPDTGSPVAAITFRVEASGSRPEIEIDSLPRASTLGISITLEPRPGATEPTGPAILSATVGL
jgi:hypothetical protein